MPCASRVSSCEHLAIDSTVANDMCDLAGELKEIINNQGSSAEEVEEAEEVLDGVCAGYHRLADKWDEPENRQAANDCYCGEGWGEFCPLNNNSCPEVELPTPPVPNDCSDPDFPPFPDGFPVIEHCPVCVGEGQ